MSTTYKFIPSRLKEVRIARGFTITALAEKTGVSKQAISQVENGVSTPSIKLLESFSQELNCPNYYFFNENHTTPFNTIFFRSLSATTKKKREQAKVKFSWFKEVSVYVEQYFDFFPVNVPSDFWVYDIDELTDNIIIDAAKECRRRWALGDGPISNVTRLLEKRGFIIGNLGIEERDVDAISEWSNNERPYILMGNHKKSAARMRFNLAHELGHIVLHRNLDREHFEVYHKKIEAQANLFAGHFLMPKESFGSEFYAATLKSFLQLKLRWKTSVKAIIVHAHHLNLISDDQYRLLNINYSRKKWGLGEPLDDDIITEVPEYFSKCLKVLITDGVQSKEDIFQKLPFSSSDLEKMICLEEGFFDKNQYEYQPKLKSDTQVNSTIRILKFDQ